MLTTITITPKVFSRIQAMWICQNCTSTLLFTYVLMHRILDAGCGSGRDSLAFMNMGYDVDAFDASIEMVKLARTLTGIKVSLNLFENFICKHKYDGIWCCASLLHVPYSDLSQTIATLKQSLSC